MRTRTIKLVCTLLCVAFLAAVAWAGESEVAGEPRPAKVDTPAKADSSAETDKPPRPAAKEVPAADLAAMVKSNNRFAWSIYAQLAKEKGNLFFSPSSIHTALSMTYAGARENTAGQMHSTLALPAELEKNPPREGAPMHTMGIQIHLFWPQERVHKAYAALLGKLKPPAKAGYKLHVANALWGQKGEPWLAEFLTTTQTNYGAGLREVNFAGAPEAARQKINKWVEEQTQDKIKNLLPKGVVKPTTRLVLTNAIYFKGDWASQFDKKLTKDAPFKLSADKSVQVPLMHRKGDYGYTETKRAQVLRMPYVGKDLSMLVFLPKKADELAALTKMLAKANLSKVVKSLRERKVDVFIPRFKLTAKFSLAEMLKKMGMVDAFGGAADFSGMNGKKDLFISCVVHKAFVDVNEEGTEAAAATAVVMERMNGSPPPPVFRADHPFIFMIHHEKTGAILFLGRVTNPKG